MIESKWYNCSMFEPIPLLKMLKESQKMVKHDTTEEIKKDLDERTKEGVEKYGKRLDENAPEDMLQYAYEECLDMAQYLKTEINKRDKLVLPGVTTVKYKDLEQCWKNQREVILWEREEYALRENRLYELVKENEKLKDEVNNLLSKLEDIASRARARDD